MITSDSIFFRKMINSVFVFFACAERKNDLKAEIVFSLKRSMHVIKVILQMIILTNNFSFFFSLIQLCSKVDKAEVLELTVHFVKETLFQKELSYRKTQHLSSVAEYERLKWLGAAEHLPTSADYERAKLAALRGKSPEKCNCGCSDEKRSPRPSPTGVSPFSFQSSLVPHSPPHVTSPLHR